MKPATVGSWALVARRLRIISAELALVADEIEGQGSQLPGATQPSILTLREFAGAIRRCEDTARDLCRAGKVPGAQQGGSRGRWTIPRAGLEAFLGQGKATLGLVSRGRAAGVPDYRAHLNRDRSA